MNWNSNLSTIATIIVVTSSMVTPPSVAQNLGPIDTPVVIGGNDEMDACYGTGVIVGLDPKGDGFLSVRSGPGGKPYREIDRRYNGQQVQLCAEKGPWLAIVYDPSGSLEPCGVRSPWPVRQAYTGPCRYGWVHSRYVKLTSG
jgi:hypothetical protein